MPFIVLEGLDGAGKSTQLKNLNSLLHESGKRTEHLHFPRFDTPVFGDLIARFLRGELGSFENVSPYLTALIYAGDRADASRMIRGWLDEGTFVVADRYVDSNIAYQCAKVAVQGDKMALRDWIYKMEYGYYSIPRPDVSLFLDVPFDFTKSRLGENRDGDDREYLKGAEDIHEKSLDLQQAVRREYLSIIDAGMGLELIDCSGPQGGMADPDTIFSRISEKITPLL